jgi:hypothetical protein
VTDKNGLGEDEQFTDPSPLAAILLAKAEEEAKILSMSAPSSRQGGSRKGRRKG